MSVLLSSGMQDVAPLESAIRSHLIGSKILGYLPLHSWGRLSLTSQSLRDSIQRHGAGLQNVSKDELFPVWMTGYGPVDVKDSQTAFLWLAEFAPNVVEIKTPATYWSLGVWPEPEWLLPFDQLRSVILLLEQDTVFESAAVLVGSIDCLEDIAFVVGSLRRCFYFNQQSVETLEEVLSSAQGRAERMKSISILARRAILCDDSYEYFSRFIKLVLSLLSDRTRITEFCLDLTDESLPNDVVEEIIQFLSDCPNLTRLYFYPFLTEVVAAIAPQLTELETGYCGWEAITSIVPNCPNLRKLHLFFADGPDAEDTIRSLAAYCPGLEQLELINCFDISEEAFRLIGSLKALATLRVEDVYESHDLSALAELPKLTNLSLGYDADQSNVVLGGTKVLKKITLNISENAAAKMSVAPEVQKSLENVELLSHCKDVDLIDLEDGLLTGAVNVRFLAIDGRLLVRHVSAIERLPQLEVLRINETNSEEDEAKLFTSSLSNISSVVNRSGSIVPTVFYNTLRVLICRCSTIGRIELVKQSFAPDWLEETLDFEYELMSRKWVPRTILLDIIRKF